MNVILAMLWIILFWGSSSFAQGKQQMPHPWSKAHLFDSKTKTYYIPYELWTGAPWNGVKEKKLHAVDRISKSGNKTTKGPRQWTHPYLNNQTFNVYERVNTRTKKVQLFIMRDKGWGRVYDRRPRKNRINYSDGGVKWPAGGGWKPGERFHSCQRRWKEGPKKKQRWRRLSIEIPKGGLEWDTNDVLESLVSMYYINGKLNYTYIFMPNRGMVKSIFGGRGGKNYQGRCE